MSSRRTFGTAAAIAALVLSACNSGAPVTSAPATQAAAPPSTGAASQSASQPATTPPSGKVTVLLVGFPDDDTVDATTGHKIPGIGHLKDAFTAANPTIDLQLINIPWGSGATAYTAKTESMVQNNEACVYLMPGAFDFGRAGKLEDLQPYVDADPTIKDAFAGKSLEAYAGWGPDKPNNLWGIPHSGGNRVVHWDQKLFEQWGVEPLSVHPTLDEIKTKAIKMTGKNPVTGQQNYGYWYQGKYINWQFQVIAHAMNANWGKVNDDGSWTIHWDTPEYLSALQWLVDMSKYAPPGALAADAMPPGFLTDQNVVAIIPEGEQGYYLPAFLGDPNLAKRFRTSYDIEGADGLGGLFSANPVSMVKSCDNKPAAWAAMKWLATSKESQRYNFEQGNLPVVKGGDAIVPEIAAWPDADPILNQNSFAEPRYPWATSDPRWSLQSAIEAALAGTLTPKQALEQAQKETDDWIAKQK